MFLRRRTSSGPAHAVKRAINEVEKATSGRHFKYRSFPTIARAKDSKPPALGGGFLPFLQLNNLLQNCVSYSRIHGKDIAIGVVQFKLTNSLGNIICLVQLQGLCVVVALQLHTQNYLWLGTTVISNTDLSRAMVSSNPN